MEARVYHNGPRTAFRKLTLTSEDKIVLSVLALVIAADVGLGKGWF